jgi:hypothetical protein
MPSLGQMAGSYAIALRLGSAAVYMFVGPLRATAGVSGWWLSSVLAIPVAWSAGFAWQVRRSGLSCAVVDDYAVVVGTDSHDPSFQSISRRPEKAIYDIRSKLEGALEGAAAPQPPVNLLTHRYLLRVLACPEPSSS